MTLTPQPIPQHPPQAAGPDDPAPTQSGKLAPKQPEPAETPAVAAEPAPAEAPADAFEQQLAVYPLREKAADPRWAVRLVWAWTGFTLFSLAFVLALLVLGLYYD